MDNQEEFDKTSVLLKRRINQHGEIHLDKTFTTLLIEMIEIEERQLDSARKYIKDIQKLVDDFIQK